jgi:hypothetical protein
MTIEQFNNTSFGKEDKCIYKRGEYLIASLDFEEKLIGLLLYIEGSKYENEITWVRCENIEYIPL